MWSSCWHPELTEPDRDGRQLCLRCGSVQVPHDLASDLVLFYLHICRDHGAYGSRPNTEAELQFAADLLRRADAA